MGNWGAMSRKELFEVISKSDLISIVKYINI